MYMKTSSNRSYYDKDTYYRDPLNIQNIKHKYLHSPYDASYRLKNNPDYLYERQLLQIQRQSIHKQINYQQNNNKSYQSLYRGTNDSVNKMKSNSLKNMYGPQLGSSGLQHAKFYDEKPSPNKKPYQDKYIPAKKDQVNKNQSVKVTNSMLGSPSKAPNNINTQIQQTSTTKAAIFRRLYDEKSKKLKIKEQVRKDKQNMTKSYYKQNQQQEQSDANQIATYLQEISFLKSQLQQKNKLIVDLQCQLIKKSAKKMNDRQRHKSDFGVNSHSHVYSQGGRSSQKKNMEISQSNLNRMQSQTIQLNLSQTRQFMPKYLGIHKLQNICIIPAQKQSVSKKFTFSNSIHYNVLQRLKDPNNQYAQTNQRKLSKSQFCYHKTQNLSQQSNQRPLSQQYIRLKASACKEITLQNAMKKQVQDKQVQTMRKAVEDRFCQKQFDPRDFQEDDQFWQLVFEQDYKKMKGKQ